MAGTRRLQVHGVEEGVASVETEDGRIFELPGWLLPPGARVGDRLLVRIAARGDALQLVVEPDRPATEAARDEAAARLRRLTQKDAGGDLDLG